MRKLLLSILMCSIYCGSNSQISDQEKVQFVRKWLSDNNVPLNTLHKVPQNELLYNCDSTLFRKETKGDTIYLWTPSGEWMQDLTDNYGKKNLPEFINNSSFGVSRYIKQLDNDGRLRTVYLAPHVFIIRNDSLLERVEYYTKPEKFIDSLYDIWSENLSKSFVSGSDSNLKKKNEDILDEIHKYLAYKFRLLFHCSMFKNGKRKYYTSGSLKKCDDVIVLENFWKNGSNEYYEIRINNDCEKDKTTYAFGIDNNFRFIYWEGCFLEEISKAKEVSKTLSPACNEK